MPLIYHTEGSVSLAAASWSDAAGLVDDATGIIEKGQQTITTNLDFSGLTDGISYLHVRSGFTGQIGSPSTPLKMKWHSTYSAKPNVILEGGTLYLTESNTAAWILVLGGRLILVSGTTTLLEVRNGYVVRGGSPTVTTLDLAGGDFSDDADNATTLGTAHIGAGTGNFRGVVTTLNTYEGGRVTYDYASALTTINMYGGRLNLLRGGATTVNGRRGILDVSKATRDQTLTTVNRWPKFAYESAGAAAVTTVTNTVDKVGGPINLSSGLTVGMP